VSPHALISLTRRPLRTGTDLKGARIAVAFGDTAEYLLRDLMVLNSIKPNEVTLTPFRFDLSPLIRGDVDAITGFATDQPHTLKNQGMSPVVLEYSEVLHAGYGYMFVAQNGRSEGLREFLNASRRGWEATFADEAKALGILHSRVGGLNQQVERDKLASVRTLMLGQDGTLTDWCIDPNVIQIVQQRMLRYGQLKQAVAGNSSYSDAYCQ
jgi:NitT/TauT family transport system substrate-binding protein